MSDLPMTVPHIMRSRRTCAGADEGEDDDDEGADDDDEGSEDSQPLSKRRKSAPTPVSLCTGNRFAAGQQCMESTWGLPWIRIAETLGGWNVQFADNSTPYYAKSTDLRRC
jgi:hypothetical protein